MKMLFMTLLVTCIVTLHAPAQTVRRDTVVRTSTLLGAPPTKKDMVVITQSEMPEPLKSTLQAVEYYGWEKGTIYRTKLNDMFLVEIRNGNNVRSYHFDVNGKPLDP